MSALTILHHDLHWKQMHHHHLNATQAAKPTAQTTKPTAQPTKVVPKVITKVVPIVVTKIVPKVTAPFNAASCGSDLYFNANIIKCCASANLVLKDNTYSGTVSFKNSSKSVCSTGATFSGVVNFNQIMVVLI